MTTINHAAVPGNGIAIRIVIRGFGQIPLLVPTRPGVRELQVTGVEIVMPWVRASRSSIRCVSSFCPAC